MRAELLGGRDEPIDTDVNDLSDRNGRAGTDHNQASRDNDGWIHGLVDVRPRKPGLVLSVEVYK